MNNPAITELLLELGLPANKSHPTQSVEALADRINDLLNTDFPKLISILYRLDVNENKLKLLLRENPGKDAGMIIAALMIDRQLQKIKSREQPGSPDPNADASEKW